MDYKIVNKQNFADRLSYGQTCRHPDFITLFSQMLGVLSRSEKLTNVLMIGLVSAWKD